MKLRDTIIMLSRLRPMLRKFLAPLAKRVNVNPNIITLISLIIAALSGVSFWHGNLLLGGSLILFSGFLDVMDGSIARYHNRTNEFGAFFDSTMDRFSDGIIILGLIAGGWINWYVGILAVHSAITISYVKASAESKGISCNVGIAERATRLIIIIIASLLGIFLGKLYLELTMIVLVILSYITVVQRIFHVWKQANK